jgi:drug/metabolite transporter (DMT)-like permease
VVTLARVALGALALMLVPAARTAVDRADLPRIALLGALWIGIPLSLLPIAQQWIDSSVVGMINGAVPVATAIWATALLRRAPRRMQAIGIAVGFAGVMAISLPEVRDSSAGAAGVILTLACVVLYGLSTNLAVPLQQRYGALPVLFRAQLAALVLVTPLGLAQLSGSRWELGPVLAMVPLGVLSTGVAYALLSVLVGRVGGPRGSVAIYLVPLVALVLGVALRGEDVGPVAVAGAAVVLAGAWLTSRPDDAVLGRHEEA